MSIWHTLWQRRRLARSRRSVVSQNSRKGRYSKRFSTMNRAKLFRLGAIAALFLSLASIVVFFFAFAWVAKDLPNPNKVVRRDGFSTKIYDRSGELLYDLFGDERRTPIAVDQVPEYLKQATIAIEDKDFYKHAGIDPLSPFRILWNVISKQRIIGGSTLTQQLVKNVLLTSERTLTRKFKQLLLSIEIERKFNKDQILQMYLNEAPYGGTAWGVGAASEVYFNKPIPELTLLESAVLAGLPQRPSVYSPYSGKNDTDGTPFWQVRAKGVLRRMREDGYITSQLEKDALAELPNLQFNKQAITIQAPHFVFHVKDVLEQMYDSAAIEQSGFKVTTSLDLSIQHSAQQIVQDEIAEVEKYHITNGSAIVMNPETGEILAMVGSKDYFAEDYDGQFNVAVDGLRQPGSSIKPITYLTALRKGYTPASIIIDTPTSFPGGEGQKDYEPQNYDGQFHGPVSLRTALGSSLNIPAVKMLALIGVENMLKNAYDLGFPTLEPTGENLQRFGLSVTLGGGEVHLLDSVTAYSSFANGGHKVEPVSILKIEDAHGKVIYEHKSVKGKEVMTPEESFLINHILSDNSARLVSFGPNSLLNYNGKAIAVKTGTTNNRKDNWTVGWSRSTIIGVWVGNNDNTPMTNVASGITGASPIWRKMMDYVLKNGRLADDWEVPSGVEAVRVDAISGYPSHDEFPERAEYVLPSTLPSLPDPIHSKLKLCRSEQGKLATEVDIQRGEYDEKEFVLLKENDPISQDGRNRWQEGIDSWISVQAADQQEKYKPPTELCGGSKDEVWIKMHKPENQKDHAGTSIEVEVETVSEGDIDRVEIWVNGVQKEVLKNKPYKTTLNLAANRYTLYAKSVRTDGKEGKTGDAHIGTGGVHWEEPEPSPTPSPSPSPSPSATPLPSPTPMPTPTPSS